MRLNVPTKRTTVLIEETEFWGRGEGGGVGIGASDMKVGRWGATVRNFPAACEVMGFSLGDGV